MTLKEILDLAIEKQKAGELAEAEALYRQLAAALPNHPLPHNSLGSVLCAMGRYSEAVESFWRVLELAPDSHEAHINMGNALRLMGRSDSALEVYEKALKLAPENPDVLFAIGTAQLDLRRFDEAIGNFKRAVTARPGFGDAFYNLGLAYKMSGATAEAVGAYRAAIAASPDNARAHSNLGGIVHALGETDEALASCRRAIELEPDFADAHNNLGSALFNSGQIDLAMSSYRRAAELAPNRSDLAGNCVFAVYYDPDCDCSTILPRFDDWNRRFAEPARKFIQPHSNDRREGRRLRIGYVSPNLRAHAEAAFILPLLEHHDRGRFEIFCYSDAVREDAVSARLRCCADTWRQTAGLGHGALAEQIRADRIDIAVDLTMHMAGSRLEAFARKPAPIQVAWLAYPGTTGLATMDYRFTDSFVDPPGEFQSHYSEQSFRLTRTFACYDPTGMVPTPFTDPPTVPGPRPFTFGCLNNVAKLNDPVISRFAAVLKAMPEAQLRLLAPPGEARTVVLERLDRFGVGPGRVSFAGNQPRAAYMNEYAQIDVSLDTLPYCGHTTSLDSMWMGVPVVTRIGASAAGRVGWSILNNLHLADLAGRDDEEFVRIAVQLAQDGPRRAELRRTLRRRLLDSPVMDGAGFARDVEDAFRQMWRRWASS